MEVINNILVLGVFAMLIGVYFAPFIVANSRDHHQQPAIFAVNLLLGWTLIGWIISMVWSLMYIPDEVKAQIQKKKEQFKNEWAQECLREETREVING